jgi:hypothetical protein
MHLLIDLRTVVTSLYRLQSLLLGTVEMHQSLQTMDLWTTHLHRKKL